MLLFLYFILAPPHFLYDTCLVDFVKWLGCLICMSGWMYDCE